MTIIDLNKIISSGETEKIEFKSSFNKTVIETLVAFANTIGGKVIIGVKDDGEITGVDINEESIQKWINEIKQKTEPSIVSDVNVINKDNKNIVVFSVQEYPIKPIAFQGRFFHRKQNSTHQMSATDVSKLHMLTMQYSWDAFPYPNVGFEDLYSEKISDFIIKVNKIGRFRLEKDHFMALNKLNLLIDGIPSNAAMILFSKKNLFCNVHIGRFKSTTHIIADTMVNGNLYDVINKSMEVIVSHIKFAFEITGEKTQRTEIPEYPLDAIRELLLNALIHRDYADPSDVIIKIFDQSIRFSNASGLYGDISIEDLHTNDYQASTRNKLLAEALYLTNDIEKYGSGFSRIRQAIANYPTMVFNYQETSNAFICELNYIKQKLSMKSVEGINEGINEGISEGINRLYNYISDNPGYRISQISKKNNVPEKTLERWVKILRDKQKIKFIGSKKTGGYWINKNSD